MAHDAWWHAGDGGIVVTVRVITGARRTEVAGVPGDALRIKLAARPVGGKANDELTRFVADLFGVRPRSVRLVHGARARAKVLHVAGIDAPPDELLSRGRR